MKTQVARCEKENLQVNQRRQLYAPTSFPWDFWGFSLFSPTGATFYPSHPWGFHWPFRCKQPGGACRIPHGGWETLLPTGMGQNRHRGQTFRHFQYFQGESNHFDPYPTLLLVPKEVEKKPNQEVIDDLYCIFWISFNPSHRFLTPSPLNTTLQTKHSLDTIWCIYIYIYTYIHISIDTWHISIYIYYIYCIYI